MDKKELVKILSMNQKEIREYLKNYCNIIGENFMVIYKSPSLPWLVAHIDVVHDWYKESRNELIIHNNEYYWSPNGLGADDRAGVYALLFLYHQGLEVNYLFTDYEEIGGLGAHEFCSYFDKMINPPYFIEIDRKGYKEAVFYNNDELNHTFVSIIKKHFDIFTGSFSDISIIGKHFNVCSVNLSAGYYNQHSNAEYLIYSHLVYTLEKVPELIKELGHKKYELPEYSHIKYGKHFTSRSYDSYYYYDTNYETTYWRDSYYYDKLYDIIQYIYEEISSGERYESKNYIIEDLMLMYKDRRGKEVVYIPVELEELDDEDIFEIYEAIKKKNERKSKNKEYKKYNKGGWL